VHFRDIITDIPSSSFSQQSNKDDKRKMIMEVSRAARCCQQAFLVGQMLLCLWIVSQLPTGVP
jgi:hypothetical protein